MSWKPCAAAFDATALVTNVAMTVAPSLILMVNVCVAAVLFNHVPEAWML
jgi:hypothetical protein